MQLKFLIRYLLSRVLQLCIFQAVFLLQAEQEKEEKESEGKIFKLEKGNILHLRDHG